MQKDPQQKQAIEHTGTPLLILAGPGSGKTFTITEKIVELIKRGLAPERILALTFSEKAATEMQDRVESRIGIESGITISTFHSFCNELIRNYPLYLGIERNVRLITKEHAHVWGIKNIDTFGFENIVVPQRPYDLINSLLEGVSQMSDHLISPAELKRHVSRALKGKTSGKESLLKLYDLALFYEHYQNYKKNNGLIDYDDMITQACELIRSNPHIARSIRARYGHILVDEFQDTNFAQLYLVHLISPGDELTCVADDDQCIYRFRGAYLSNITQLSQYYPDIKKITLNNNYRSDSQIVELSRQLIEKNPAREHKELRSYSGNGDTVKAVRAPDDASEAKWVASRIEELLNDGIPPKEIFILTRKRADGKKFNDELKKRLIPVEFVGSLQLDRFPVVIEAMAYIHIVANPFNRGVDFARVLAREGVGEYDLQKINNMALCISREEKGPGDGIYYTLLHKLDELGLENKELVQTIINRLQDMLEYRRKHLPSDTVKHLLFEMTDLYNRQVIEDTTASRKNINILNSLISTIEDLELIDGGSELEEVVEDLELVFGLELEEGTSTDENNVKVMTIHQSKGKEAEVVFVCDLASRHLPLNYRKKTFTVPAALMKGAGRQTDSSILHMEEERRLAYVAMTRAKKQLYLVHPLWYKRNKTGVTPSMFLQQLNYKDNPLIDLIEAEVVEHQEQDIQPSPLALKKEEQLKFVNMYAKQGQIKQAMESLAVLAQLKEMELYGNLDNFNIRELFNINIRSVREMNDLVNEALPPLIDPEMKFSASGLRTYKECPLKFKYGSVLSIPATRKIYFQVGTSIHKVYEELAKAKMENRPLNIKTARKMLIDNWDHAAYPTGTLDKQEFSKMNRMIEYWFSFSEEYPGETIAVEKRFDLTVYNIRFAGIIDRIDRNSKGDYILIDYKTGKDPLTKYELKKDMQIAIYCLAIKQLYGKLPAKAGHLYVNPELAMPVFTDVTQKDINAVLKDIKAITKKILKEDFSISTIPNCYNCDYKGFCEWYQSQ